MNQGRGEKEFFTPEELAEHLRIGRTKVYEILTTGGADRLASYKVGRLRRVRRQDLERWLEHSRDRFGA